MRIRWIRELFSFSRKERSGIILLLLIIFLLILVGMLIPLLMPKENTNFSAWEGEVNSYLKNTEPKVSKMPEFNLESFDPNRVDSAVLTAIGLPEKLTANWIKYLRRGGRFRDKEEVRKIYGMTPQIFERLDPYLVFSAPMKVIYKPADEKSSIFTRKGPLRDSVFHPQYEKKVKPLAVNLELNNTDSMNLIKIPGIGTVLASRIIRYRNLLGGFYQLSQIKEVYGLREENFNLVSTFLSVDASLIKTLNINFSTIQDLGHHPYIGYRSARKLVWLRDKKGKFLSAADLTDALGSDSLKRLIPYLRFSP